MSTESISDAGGSANPSHADTTDPTQAGLREQVETMIKENPVLLFMKGTPDAPRCGFSQRTVQMLNDLEVEYGALDVLPVLNPLRDVTRELADWSTFPQLWVNGELVGGHDICAEMYESGELAEALGVAAKS